MRLNLMPPDVEPAPPPTHMSAAMTRNAPEVSDVVSWLVVTFWKPVVENADTMRNTPRRIMVARFEKSELAETDAANTKVITAIQMNMVRISMSRKYTFRCPFHSSECSTKFTDPMIMRSMSTTSMGNEW